MGSMERGYNIRGVFDRFVKLVHAVEAACKSVGRKIEIHEKYGHVCSCPSNCGTGLRASMMLKIPLASKEPNFKDCLRNVDCKHGVPAVLPVPPPMMEFVMFPMLIA